MLVQFFNFVTSLSFEVLTDFLSLLARDLNLFQPVSSSRLWHRPQIAQDARSSNSMMLRGSFSISLSSHSIVRLKDEPLQVGWVLGSVPLWTVISLNFHAMRWPSFELLTWSNNLLRVNISLMVSLFMAQTNLRQDEHRAKSPSKSSRDLTSRALRR